MKLSHSLIAPGAALAAALAAAIPGAALAAPVTTTYSTSNGVAFNTDGLTGFVTNGDDMVGMKVTVYFAGGGSDTATWAATGADAGAATGTGWSLVQNGDTFDNDWVLTNTSTAGAIIGFLLDGSPGQTVFDIGSPPAPQNSPGSASGAFFQDGDSTDAGVTAANGAYTNRVSVVDVFYGDLFEQLSVSFTGTGLGAGGVFTFRADADNAASDTPLTQVPEPMTLALFGLGLAGLGLARRRRS